jgi:LytS/YehU family sensor histidine kinase
MLKKLLQITIINQISGFVLSMITVLISSTFYRYNINIAISLIFTNSVGYIYFVIDTLFKRYLRETIEIKIFKRLSKIFLIFLSLFLGIELSLFLSRLLLPIQMFSVSESVQNFLMITNIILIFIVVFLGFIYKKLKTDIENEMKENERLEKLKLKSELAALQSKINPHFLFNTLNTILDLVYDYPEKVEEMILNLSTIYRKILYSSENEYYTLEQEIDLVKKYLDIEKVRLGKRMEYEIICNSELKNVEIPPLCIEPIVENSIIHGISPKKGNGKIQIVMKTEDKKIKISVIDDGVGIESKDFKLGFGVRSVKERLKILYGEETKLEIKQNEKNGVTVEIEFPLKEAKK